MPTDNLLTIGLLGGMSSAATAEYYTLINQEVKEIKGGFTTAELLICSVNFANIERFVRTGNWEEAACYLAGKAQSLERAGANCLFLGSNTMHKVRAQLKEAIRIPFIDIFETVAVAIRKQGLVKIGMLGTYPVMTDPFYAGVFRDYGIELVNPDESDKREIDRIIFDEMTNHQFLPLSKEFFSAAIDKLVQKGAQGIILGCTEIKLLIQQKDVKSVPLFDTTTLHCKLAANICTGTVKLPQAGSNEASSGNASV